MEVPIRNLIVDENAMDIESSGEDVSRNGPTVSTTGIQPLINGDYDVVVVSSVGLHVEGLIPFINPEIPVEQHTIVQIEANDVETNSNENERISPVPSVVSSRGISPICLPEESNQSYPEENEKDSKKRSLSDDEDDGRICSICLDYWTNTGDHRVCALKCGHLFGYKCVLRWLDTQSKKSCPTCKKKVNKSDIRFIYAKKLMAIDSSELEMMRTILDKTIEEKNRLLLDIKNYMVNENVLRQEIDSLKRQLESRSQPYQRYGGVPAQTSSTSTHCSFRFYMDKSLEICPQNGCRVFDVHPPSDQIMVSMKSQQPWTGYGIRKVNISTYKPLAFIPVHSQQIRDISFHPVNNCVLTASMDKTFKVINTQTNSILYTRSESMPLWSCCWDVDNEHILYIGTQSGAVVKYDTRNIAQPVCTLTIPGDMSPVVSIASIPSRVDSDLVNGGVISCKLNSLWIFENSGNFHVRHPLPLEGPFVSMKYQPETKQLLVSSRPNNRISYARHQLCTLEKVGIDKVNCNPVHCFEGGGMQKLLSKSCFVSDKQDYVAAYQESSKCIYLWSINTGQRMSPIPAHDAVLDLQGLQTNNKNFLVSLTERKLEFFKLN